MVEFISKIRFQFNALFGDMQSHQKMTLVALGLMVMVPFGMLIFGGDEGGTTPLQYGAAFDSEVRAQAEQVLLDRGFNDFQTVGSRILVPTSKVDEYNGALMAAGISSPHAYDELESALRDVNPFTPPHEFAARMKIQLSQKIRNNLRAIDGIRDAQVIWSRPEGKSRWGKTAGVKASVHVTPDGGRELPRRLVESLRNSVATMVPDLERENVVVIDRSTGQSWAGNDPDYPFDNKLEELKRSRVQFHQMRIQDALNEIAPNSVVAVHVEFDKVLSTRERTQQIDKGVELTSILETEESSNNEGPASGTPGTSANRPGSVPSSNAQQVSSTDKSERSKVFSAPSMSIVETEGTPLNETALQVAVSIPEGHIEKLVVLDGVPQGTTDEEKATFLAAVVAKQGTFKATVEEIVTSLIPPNSPEGSVVVTTHRRIEQDIPQLDLPITDMLKDFFSTWGSSIALTLFGVWALMLLKKSMPVSESAPSTAALDKLSNTVTTAAADFAAAATEKEVAAAEATPKYMSDRETLEATVENDPSVAAAIISKWLREA
jgi:flagellar biosynthesis/type III secretory pathway M-ring protein FliF/YscJ